MRNDLPPEKRKQIRQFSLLSIGSAVALLVIGITLLAFPSVRPGGYIAVTFALVSLAVWAFLWPYRKSHGQI